VGAGDDTLRFATTRQCISCLRCTIALLSGVKVVFVPLVTTTGLSWGTAHVTELGAAPTAATIARTASTWPQLNAQDHGDELGLGATYTETNASSYGEKAASWCSLLRNRMSKVSCRGC